MSWFDRIPGFGSKQPKQQTQSAGDQAVRESEYDATPDDSEPAFPPLEEKKPGIFGPRSARKREKAVSSPEPASHDRPSDELPKRRGLLPSLASGFFDPIRRPRYIIISVMAVVILLSLVIVALGVTSTRWFCSEGCHKVQDDTILAYERSSHSEVSCMACHMPVGANPAVFLLHKAEALGELYLTVTDQYELPLNGESEVALTMPSEQCTQCHDLTLRKVTPARGVKIDHAAHAKKGVECTVCHNRVAHREDFEPKLKDPETGKRNEKHEVFTSMTACFRCHTQGESASELAGPGDCLACHPEGFDLKPAFHKEAGFFPEGHGKMGEAAASRAESAAAEIEVREAAAKLAGEERGHGEESLGESLPKTEGINSCSTCHNEDFCSDCHGVPMPHPADFRKGHGKFGKKNPKACTRCHGAVERFCDDCHHGRAMDRVVDQSRTWIGQHFDAVRELGAARCFKCHSPTFCARCHVRGGK